MARLAESPESHEPRPPALDFNAAVESGSWVAASSVALLTGAMGCVYVGYSGMLGLGLGTAMVSGLPADCT